MKIQWNTNGNRVEISLKYKRKNIGNPVKISSKYKWNINGNFNPVQISKKHQWKSIGNPIENSMKYKWKSIGNPVGIYILNSNISLKFQLDNQWISFGISLFFLFNFKCLLNLHFPISNFQLNLVNFNIISNGFLLAFH